MQNDNGGFSSTIDADSEGKEGKYYVWSDNELNKILDEGKEKAEDIANQTLKRVKSKLGFFEMEK